MQQERKPVIVFVTHSPAYAPRGYGIAIRYLCKPISFEKFRSTLYVAQEKAQLDRMLVHCEGEQVVLRLQDIQYVEVLSHCLLFHLGNGQVITERNSLSAIMSQLPAWQFVQSHKSYCVNLDYVQRANVNTVTLTDGTEIPLSRGNITHFRDCLSQFVNRKNAMG
jgi:DNA-binding LytR/AlgR family response regulator